MLSDQKMTIFFSPVHPLVSASPTLLIRLLKKKKTKKKQNKTKQNKRTTWKILKHVSALMTRDWNIYQHAIKWFDRDNLSPAWPRWEHSKTNFSCF